MVQIPSRVLGGLTQGCAVVQPVPQPKEIVKETYSVPTVAAKTTKRLIKLRQEELFCVGLGHRKEKTHHPKREKQKPHLWPTNSKK